MLLELTERFFEKRLSKMSRSSADRLLDKLEEYEEKPDLLESNLKIEQAGAYKDFFKKHKVKLGHFRVGDTRIIGLLKGETFYVVEAVPRGALEKELDRIVSQFPFPIE
ncbi:MAG: hypothetical protein KKF41_06085 [Actinobacteria bacterium]|nr:hypothetical protein [Actinomycetota bacterium]MBU2687133.1 hypothetical protein [Actinomycetota bacterium]